MQLAHMTWPQAEAYFKDNDIILLSVGSIECHGKHLPLGTDTLIPQKLLEMIEPLTDVAIAPIIPFGVCDSLSDYPGTVSLGQDTLYQVLTKITQGYRAHGVRRFVVLNGHGGNIPVLDQVALDLQRQGCMLAEMNWWLMAWDMNPAWKGGHGGGEETAAILGIDPSLVDKSEIGGELQFKHLTENLKTTGFRSVEYKGVSVEILRNTPHVTDSGWIGPDHPSTATEEWGKEMLETTANYIVDFMEEFKKVKLS